MTEQEINDSEDTTITEDIKIQNKYGLHVRATEKLVRLVKKFEVIVTIKKGKHEANAKSIMDVMMLAARKGSELQIIATGKDAKPAMKAIIDLVNDKFGEDD